MSAPVTGGSIPIVGLFPTAVPVAPSAKQWPGRIPVAGFDLEVFSIGYNQRTSVSHSVTIQLYSVWRQALAAFEGYTVGIASAGGSSICSNDLNGCFGCLRESVGNAVGTKVSKIAIVIHKYLHVIIPCVVNPVRLIFAVEV